MFWLHYIKFKRAFLEFVFVLQKMLVGLALARRRPKPQTKKFNPAKIIVYSSWAQKRNFKTYISILISYKFFLVCGSFVF